MSILSTLPTSRRGYLSQTELAEYADITILDTDEADDQISQAEELVDAFVGFQQRFIWPEVIGIVAGQSGSTFTLYASHQNVFEKDYFAWCEVEIIKGTGQGQRRKITASTKAGVVTIDLAWTTTPDSTSFYRIYQLGKFPRQCDARYFSEIDPVTVLKTIPEVVKRAVAAQVQYQIEMGDDFFSTDKSEKTSESIGDYSYSNGTGAGTAGVSTNKLIAPKAKSILHGIRNRTGEIV